MEQDIIFTTLEQVMIIEFAGLTDETDNDLVAAAGDVVEPYTIVRDPRGRDRALLIEWP